MSERVHHPDHLHGDGVLSIVVQGPLSAGNLVETARNCRHWRRLFPKAEIVLSISITDVLEDPSPGPRNELRLSPEYRYHGQAQVAAAVLRDSCDVVLVSSGDLPLPTFKDDSGPNNSNLQIAAAKAGLAAAGGGYVLRTRSDLVFRDTGFIARHLEDRDLSRGPAAVFEERVLISWLFTLNPLTIERMPFHFSDWFNFGRLSDVKRLWDVPPMTLADAVRYRALDHPAHSNRRERQFYSRVGIEQHLHFTFFRSMFPSLRLASHNDTTSMAASLAILADNFTLCDVGTEGVFFEKYREDMLSPEKRFHCIRRKDWLSLVENRSAPPQEVLHESLAAACAAGYL